MIGCSSLLAESGILRTRSGRAGSGLGIQSAGYCPQQLDDYAVDPTPSLPSSLLATVRPGRCHPAGPCCGSGPGRGLSSATAPGCSRGRARCRAPGPGGSGAGRANCVLSHFAGRRACPARTRARGRTTRGHSLARWITGAHRHREPGASRRGSHCGGVCRDRAAACGSPWAPTLWGSRQTTGPVPRDEPHGATRWRAGSPERIATGSPAPVAVGRTVGAAAGTELPRADRRGRQLRRVCIRSLGPIHGPLTGLVLSPVNGGRSSGGRPSGRPGITAGRRLRLGR